MRRATPRAGLCRTVADSVVAALLVVAVSTLALAALAVGEYAAWWSVCLPALIGATLLWVFFGALVVLWLMRCRGNLDGEEELFLDVTLDAVLTVFKFCVAMHAYMSVVVLCLAVGLVCAITDAPSYWIAPVFVLATFHLTLSALLKEPEVSPRIHLLAGLSIFGHMTFFGLKLTVKGCAEWPWWFVFTPSWLTYGGFLLFISRPSRKARFRFVLALSALAVAFLAQFFLTLRLDGHWDAPWGLIFALALVTTLLVTAGVGPPAAGRLYMVLATIALAEDNAHQKVARPVGFFESDDEAKHDVPVPAA
jgi:hypothetical protein